MSSKKEETASFMLRFTQKIYEGDKGEHQVQWRGSIRHVQGGDETRFSEFEDVISFIQGKLTEMTIKVMEDKTPEEQKGILSKSFDLWKKVAVEAPKLVVETIKDPKKQVAHLQDQIQDQFLHVKDEINQKLDMSSWWRASQDDYNRIINKIDTLAGEVASMKEQLEELSKPKGK